MGAALSACRRPASVPRTTRVHLLRWQPQPAGGRARRRAPPRRLRALGAVFHMAAEALQASAEGSRTDELRHRMQR